MNQEHRVFAPSEEIAAYLPALRERRRYLHAHPELSAQETATAAWIERQLRALAPDRLESCADTGVRAVFLAAGAERTIALRADIDALRIDEKNEVPYRSQVPGIMHACGHDGHASLMLAAADLAARLRGEGRLRHNVVFLFQPAEETIGGAERMCAQGALDDPAIDAIYGFHLSPDVPLGRIALKPGPLMASTREVDITLHGKSAHGALPHQGGDAVAAAAHFLTALPAVIARRIDPIEPRLVTFGRIEAGAQRNVLAATARMEGIVRTFSDAIDASIAALMREVLATLEPLFGVTYQIDEATYYPSVENSAALCEETSAILGEAAVPAVMALTAEDFAYYQRRVPGLFMFLGCGDGRRAHPLHHGGFDFDETALLWGLELVFRLMRA